MSDLNRAYNLAKTSDYARKVRGDVKLFQACMVTSTTVSQRI